MCLMVSIIAGRAKIVERFETLSISGNSFAWSWAVTPWPRLCHVTGLYFIWYKYLIVVIFLCLLKHALPNYYNVYHKNSIIVLITYHSVLDDTSFFSMILHQNVNISASYKEILAIFASAVSIYVQVLIVIWVK